MNFHLGGACVYDEGELVSITIFDPDITQRHW